MNNGILIEPMINRKEHGIATQAETFSLHLKITNLENVPSAEFNIKNITLHSAEGQSIREDFSKSFYIERLNPEESKIIEIGNYGSYMHGLVNISASVLPTSNAITLNLLQRNPFTKEVTEISKNSWNDFFHVKSSVIHEQQKANKRMIALTIIIGILTLIQLLTIFIKVGKA